MGSGFLRDRLTLGMRSKDARSFTCIPQVKYLHNASIYDQTHGV
jgi:hypothetical protein